MERYTRGGQQKEASQREQAWGLKQLVAVRICLEFLALEESKPHGWFSRAKVLAQDLLLQSQDPPNHWNGCLFHKLLPQPLLLISSNPL